MISIASLVAAGIEPTQARIFAEPLAEACDRFDIDTPQRIAGFIGQARVETRDFLRLEENLRYTTPSVLDETFSAVKGLEHAAALIAAGPKAIANCVYANRFGNGDEASGDGWRHRGSGLFHLTFRDNFRDAGIALGRPYVEQPELVRMPEDACLTAAWYWHSRGCNAMADELRWNAITKAVNPAMLKHVQRRQYAIAAVGAFQA